jgi:hypothetical protein
MSNGTTEPAPVIEPLLVPSEGEDTPSRFSQGEGPDTGHIDAANSVHVESNGPSSPVSPIEPHDEHCQLSVRQPTVGAGDEEATPEPGQGEIVEEDGNEAHELNMPSDFPPASISEVGPIETQVDNDASRDEPSMGVQAEEGLYSEAHNQLELSGHLQRYNPDLEIEATAGVVASTNKAVSGPLAHESVDSSHNHEANNTASGEALRATKVL